MNRSCTCSLAWMLGLGLGFAGCAENVPADAQPNVAQVDDAQAAKLQSAGEPSAKPKTPAPARAAPEESGVTKITQGLGRKPTEEEKKLWGELCAPPDNTKDLPADLRSQVLVRSSECRQLVAARARIDADAMNKMANCSIELRANKPTGDPRKLMQDCMGAAMFERMEVADAKRETTAFELMKEQSAK